jgi:hypothetical protein
MKLVLWIGYEAHRYFSFFKIALVEFHFTFARSRYGLIT